KHKQFVTDPILVQFIVSLLGTPGPRLFRYQRDGQWVNVDARDVNDYLQGVAGFPYTAKDLRTWGGTLRAAIFLAEQVPAKAPTARKKNVLMMVRAVSKDLGNTPAICRKSYVHPAVITRYLKNGATIVIPDRSRPRSRLANTVEEEALIQFLDEHFPERRSDPRARETEKSADAAGERSAR
ncbi:MAG TPA: hypothetical protein VM939_09630, partial [Gemmatimonadaceae bacterium]|nr:hypothetical protein [Gemmatimonadaceae bacterium]